MLKNDLALIVKMQSTDADVCDTEFERRFMALTQHCRF